LSGIREFCRRAGGAVIVLALSLFSSASAGSGQDRSAPPVPLQDVLAAVTQTDPEVLEALERYRSVAAERSIADAGRWPTVGTELNAGQEVTDGLDTSDQRENLTAATATLYARQNLFNGGKTRAFINETEARVLAAAHEVSNVANRVFLEVAERYIDVLKALDLLDYAEENVLIQEKILIQVKEKTAAGFNRISDLNSAEARLALARGNLISKQQDLNQALVQFHRQFGRLLKPEQFVAPTPAYQFPATVEEVVDMALRRHPALKVADTNILVRKHSYEKAKADDWPTLDLEFKAQHRENTNGDEGQTDQASAMLKFNYTFFDGGIRKGQKGKLHGELQKEYRRSYVERRNVNQTARLAWNIYTAEKQKKKFLAEHLVLSARTLEDFKEEYFVGRRNLLDLLNMENEYNSAENADAESKYALLVAYFRISQATGLLLSEYNAGLQEQLGLPPEEPYALKGYDDLDRDRDVDTVDDLRDQCDNTEGGAPVLSSGCAEDAAVSVGYDAPRDVGPYILPEEETPDALNLDIDPAKDEQSIHLDALQFESDAADLTDDTRDKLVPIAEQLKAADGFLIEVIGHTDSTASVGHNQRLSLARALRVQDELVKLGVEQGRMRARGRGESEPIASNETEDGKRKNRRIEFKLIQSTDDNPPEPPAGDGTIQDPLADLMDAVDAERYILPEKGTPEALNLKIDRLKPIQSIHLDLMHFGSDSADITEDIRIVLKHIAPQLKSADGFIIEVIGHTDDTAGAAHNQALSLSRARSVADELARLGVDREVLVVSGRGEAAPVATNLTEEGKRKNRRIEFKLIQKPFD
jgi:outer membrane protein, adhesin transport system